MSATRFAAPLAVGLGLALAGCATSEGPTPDPTPPSAPATPDAPEAPPEILVEPVRFSAPNGLTLEGTLRRPARTGPVPGIVLVHGSGPLGRKSEVPGQLGMGFGFLIPMFEQLAIGLAERGFAVLTYDKRTCGAFNQCAENDYPAPTLDLTLDVLLKDALAAGDALASDPAVDANRILILGHSQGGTLVPHALAARPGWRGGIMIATPYRSVDAVVRAQADKIAELLRATGSTDPSNNPVERLAQDVAKVRSLSEGDPLLESVDPTDALAGAQPLFWRSWMDLSDRAPDVARATARPVAILGGTMDWNVPVSEVALWEEALAGMEGARFVRMPQITHALNRLEETDIERLRPEHIGRRVHPVVIESVAEAARALLAFSRG